MFRLPHPPSPHAEIHELADFVEWCAWRDGVFSARAANMVLDQLDDNTYNEGCNDDSDLNGRNLDEVFLELDRRKSACGGAYPFELNQVGSVLRFDDSADPRGDVYLYLLLGTRLNMKDDRVHANLDGADLLEKIAAHVMRNYLCRERARSEIFGTADKGTFEMKVNRLCQALGEGGGFKHWDTGPIRAKDAKLDVVTWVPFSDAHPGKLIVFTQCKTGSTWQDRLGDLNPEAFFKTWTRDRCALLNPIRAFCVSEAASQAKWTELTTQAGLLLDRCRIVDFAHGLSTELEHDLCQWTQAAFESLTE